MKDEKNLDVQEHTYRGRRLLRSSLKNTIAAFCNKLERSILTHPSFEGSVVFGPVPSRRLGYSLGINTIKHKICTYDCVYCQVGQTTCRSTCGDCCLSPYELYFFVKEKIEQLESQKARVDYITFIPNGEPTLDSGLAKEIALLKDFGYKIAVFTNSSLLWNDKVKENLLFADYVSVKVDTVNEATWEALNRPHRRLRLDRILDGIREFTGTFEGVLTTETMLIKNVNDSLEEIGRVGDYLDTVKRSASYFTIPTRPPVEQYAVPPEPRVLEELAKVIRRTIPKSEMLCSPESGDFIATESIEKGLRGILAVHPMREDAVEQLVRVKGGSKDNLEEMIRAGLIHKVMYKGTWFYVGSH
jgi:wyosine [tRNA(Phe)-imidazoG37] synthetase (radical SAM superfamily)